MAEHLLLADLGAPLLLVGLRNPVLAFFLPARRARGAGAAAAAARRRSARCAARWWRSGSTRSCSTAGTSPFPFEGAVRHELVHVAQHASFIFAGVLVWWSAIEPKRRRLRGELWKIAHILGARMIGMFLGMASC